MKLFEIFNSMIKFNDHQKALVQQIIDNDNSLLQSSIAGDQNMITAADILQQYNIIEINNDYFTLTDYGQQIADDQLQSSQRIDLQPVDPAVGNSLINSNQIE